VIVNYNCNCSFIVLATVIMIVNYNCKTFIVQATGDLLGQLEELGIDPDIGCRLLLLPDVDIGVFSIANLEKSLVKFMQMSGSTDEKGQYMSSID
jgi:hypothetical protein